MDSSRDRSVFEEREQGVGGAAVLGGLRLEDFGHGVGQEGGIAERREFDEPRAVGESVQFVRRCR
jgi:hypothetical protein